MDSDGPNHRLLLQERSEAVIGYDRARRCVEQVYAKLYIETYRASPTACREQLVLLDPSYSSAVEARQDAYARQERADAAVRAWEGDLAEDARVARARTLELLADRTAWQSDLDLVRSQALSTLREAQTILDGLREGSPQRLLTR